MSEDIHDAEKEMRKKSSVNNSQTERHTSVILPAWLIKLCRPSRMIWLAPLLGFILSVPSFFSGYSMDDHVFRQYGNEKSIYHQRPAWDFFNLTSSDKETALYREKGLFGWWTPDGFRFHEFRPLASLIHAVQFHFFDGAPWVMHLFLALLYALLIFLCAKVLVQFSTSAVSLGIAVLLFAINDTHASAVGWIASYNTILCCIFGFYSFLLYTRWRQKKEHGALVLSIALFMISLLSSEGGLALMGYLIAYALFIEKNNWLKKAAHLSPYVIISLGYVAFYTLHHYGAKCSGVYLSPADDPAGTFFSVLSNTLVLTVSQIFSFAPLTIIFAQAGVVGTIAALLFFIISFVLLRKFIFSNSKVAFFGTGMLLSIIPFTLLSAPMDRLLMWSGFGAAGFLGELFTMQINKIGKVQKFFTRTLLFNNTVFSLLFFIPVQFLMTGFDKPAQLIAQQVTVDKTILLNAPFDVILMYPPAFKCEKGEDWPEHFYCLYAGADTLIIKRTAENELLATTTRGWFAADGEQTTRPEYLPFKEGDTVDLQLMSAKIEKVSSDGRPLGVTFTFKNDISEYSWLKWENKEPRKCKLPPVGGEMKLFASFF